MRFGNVESSADAEMTDTRDEGRESTSLTETTEGQPQQQQDGERHHDQQQQEAPPTVEDADQGLQRMDLKKIVLLLARIFDQIFVKP